MNLKEDFINQFNICINKNGKPKACGRDNCTKLIMIADKIEPNKNHGDKYAFMNLENLITLYNNIINIK